MTLLGGKGLLQHPVRGLKGENLWRLKEFNYIGAAVGRVLR